MFSLGWSRTLDSFLGFPSAGITPPYLDHNVYLDVTFPFWNIESWYVLPDEIRCQFVPLLGMLQVSDASSLTSEGRNARTECQDPIRWKDFLDTCPAFF